MNRLLNLLSALALILVFSGCAQKGQEQATSETSVKCTEGFLKSYDQMYTIITLFAQSREELAHNPQQLEGLVIQLNQGCESFYSNSNTDSISMNSNVSCVVHVDSKAVTISADDFSQICKVVRKGAAAASLRGRLQSL